MLIDRMNLRRKVNAATLGAIRPRWKVQAIRLTAKPSWLIALKHFLRVEVWDMDEVTLTQARSSRKQIGMMRAATLPLLELRGARLSGQQKRLVNSCGAA